MVFPMLMGAAGTSGGLGGLQSGLGMFGGTSGGSLMSPMQGLSSLGGAFTGAGIKKQQKANDAAESHARNVISRYMQDKVGAGNQMQAAGEQFQRRGNEAQLAEYGNRAAMAQNAPGDMATQYARAMEGARGAMGTAQSQIPEAELRSAAQRAYAGQLAGQAGQRAMNAQMPGAYSQAMQQVGQNQANLGRNTQMVYGQIQSDANQMGGMNRLRNAELDRNFASDMGGAQTQMAKAGQIGGEQMMYGAMLNTLANLGGSAAGSMNQMSLQESDRQQNEAIRNEMMKYYQMQQQNQPQQYMRPLGGTDYGSRTMAMGA